jgi:hypothetical protein
MFLRTVWLYTVTYYGIAWRELTNYVGSDWIPDLFTMEIKITATTIALVTSRIPPAELHCTARTEMASCYSLTELTSNIAAFYYNTQLAQWKHWPSYCWLPCNTTVPEWWAYPCKYPTSGCLATTRVLHSNDGTRPNTSHYWSYFAISQRMAIFCL